MTTRTLTLLVLLCVLLAPFAAKADTTIYINRSHGRPYWHHRHHHRPVHYPYWRAAPPVASFVYAPQPVVYETTIIRPARTVVEPVLSATQTTPNYVDTYGRTCREYQTTGFVAGSHGNMYGTACLQPDGTWRVVN